MKKTIIVLILLSTLPVFGQTHFIGVKGGLNLTNNTAGNMFHPDTYRAGFTGGLSYDYIFKNNINIGVALLYAQKGNKLDLNLTDQYGNSLGNNLVINYNYDYISLPIKAGYSIGDKLKGVLNLGVVPSLSVSAKTVAHGFKDNSLIGLDLNDQISKFDFGALIEVGGSYKLNQKFLLVASIDLQKSFTNFIKDPFFPDHRLTHYGVTFSAGLKYALK